jgi:rhamnose utilization protein RhaD (predicted bifunctional aldolase and dehydrogenase)
MTNTQFTELVEAIGNNQAYFQGTGGNISLKINEHEMLIKASGTRVKDMATQLGLVKVLYSSIRAYFNESTKEVVPNEGETIIKNSIVLPNDKRPSIETGFHAILGNAVIHSHSVYANILTCSLYFPILVKEIFGTTTINYKIVEYATPGHALTQKVKEVIGTDTITPVVIFMKNHGVIVSARTLDEVLELHEKVTDTIKKYFNLQIEYPVAKLQHLESGESISSTPFLLEFLKNKGEYFSTIHDKILFPDLTVFCKDLLVTNDMEYTSKIIVNPEEGIILYNTNKKEAHIIEENFVTWAYLLTTMEELQLVPEFISRSESEVIENLESEKYRKMMTQ